MRQSTLLPIRNDKTDKGVSFAPEIAIPQLLKWAQLLQNIGGYLR